MPLELRPGSVVPIPCRHCARMTTRFTVAEGTHTLPCSRCGNSTEIQVYAESGAWRIRTSASGKGRPPK
jgi:hypothetical protein